MNNKIQVIAFHSETGYSISLNCNDFGLSEVWVKMQTGPLKRLEGEKSEEINQEHPWPMGEEEGLQRGGTWSESAEECRYLNVSFSFYTSKVQWTRDKTVIKPSVNKLFTVNEKVLKSIRVMKSFWCFLVGGTCLWRPWPQQTEVLWSL